jgi:hypothetical protein
LIREGLKFSTISPGGAPGRGAILIIQCPTW